MAIPWWSSLENWHFYCGPGSTLGWRNEAKANRQEYQKNNPQNKENPCYITGICGVRNIF